MNVVFVHQPCFVDYSFWEQMNKFCKRSCCNTLQESWQNWDWGMYSTFAAATNFYQNCKDGSDPEVTSIVYYGNGCCNLCPDVAVDESCVNALYAADLGNGCEPQNDPNLCMYTCTDKGYIFLNNNKAMAWIGQKCIDDATCLYYDWKSQCW